MDSHGWLRPCEHLKIFELLDSLLELAKADLQTEWMRYSGVVKPPSMGPTTGARMGRWEFGQRLYHMSMFGEPIGERQQREPDGDDGSDGDDPPEDDTGEPGPDVVFEGGRGRGRGRRGRGRGGRGRGDGGIPGAVPDGVDIKAAASALRRFADRRALMRSYLQCVLQRYQYVTLPATDARGNVQSLEVFQILDLNPKGIFVETYKDKQTPAGQCDVTVQPYEIFDLSGLDLVVGLYGRRYDLDIYKVADAHTVDILNMTGVSSHVREHMESWTVGRSEFSGCWLLSNPKPSEPRGHYMGSSYPVLRLVDMVEAQRFLPIEEKVIHRRHGRKNYDFRKLASSRQYLQVLLNSDILFRAGVTEIHSAQQNHIID